MLLIVITTIGSLALAAHGWPGTALTALDGARHGARVRRLQRDQPLVRPRHRRAHGAHERAPRRQRPRARPRRARPRRSCSRRPASPCCARGALARGPLGRSPASPATSSSTPSGSSAGRRRTSSSAGRAGAVPPLVAWAAVDGSVTATAVALFAIVFLWTPPHFWSPRPPARRGLRARRRADAADRARRRRRARARSCSTPCCSSRPSLVPVALGTLSWLYAIAARAARRALHLARRATPASAGRPRDRAAHLPLLAALPRPAVRRHGHRQRASELGARVRRRGARAR